MTRRLDIDVLMALTAIAECGGVTRAAAQLSLSQSAVSHKIKRLEESIDCVLLNRKPGTPLLTEAGNRLLAYANRILTLHDEALLSLSKRTLEGNIRLGITEDTTSAGLASILARFARLFPDVSVRTHVSQSMILERELDEGAIDIAVMQVFASDVGPNDTVLHEDHLHWIKSLDFHVNLDRPIPYLAFDGHCFYRKWMLDHGSSQGHQFKTVFECASNAGVIAAVESGLGIAIINDRYVTPAMEIIVAEFPPAPDIAYVVRTPLKSSSRAVKALAQEITNEIGAFPHSLVAE